jgi:hypothetical protein
VAVARGVGVLVRAPAAVPVPVAAGGRDGVAVAAGAVAVASAIGAVSAASGAAAGSVGVGLVGSAVGAAVDAGAGGGPLAFAACSATRTDAGLTSSSW